MRLLISVTVLVLTATAFSQAEQNRAYFDKQEAKSIEQCIRENISKSAVTEETRVDVLKIGQEWVCKQLMYGWDEDQNLRVLIEPNDFGRPIFKFVSTSETVEHGLVDNAAAFADGKKHYIFFDHISLNGLSGYFSRPFIGPIPRKQDFLTFSGDFMFWEESVRNADYNEKSVPALRQRPFALYDTYNHSLENDRYRVTNYGVCYLKGSKAEKSAPCFPK